MSAVGWNCRTAGSDPSAAPVLSRLQPHWASHTLQVSGGGYLATSALSRVYKVIDVQVVPLFSCCEDGRKDFEVLSMSELKPDAFPDIVSSRHLLSDETALNWWAGCSPVQVLALESFPPALPWAHGSLGHAAFQETHKCPRSLQSGRSIRGSKGETQQNMRM